MWISIINKKKKNILMEDIMWLIMKAHLTNQLEILSIKTAMLIIKWDKEDRENQVTLRKYKILIWFMMVIFLIQCLINTENLKSKIRIILSRKSTKMIQICIGQSKHLCKMQMSLSKIIANLNLLMVKTMTVCQITMLVLMKY